MPQPQIPPPEGASPLPDAETKLGLPDHTGMSPADGRVLRVNLGFLKFGTDDKAQAVAFILSVFMLILLVVLAIFAPDSEQATNLASLLEKAVLITIGVAVGQSLHTKKG